MTEKYGFVYIWFDKKKKRYYVGSHWGQDDDGYVCSSPWMLQAHFRRPETFKRRIIRKIYTTQTDMYLSEQHYLDMIKPKEIGKRYYNLHTDAKGWNWHQSKNGRDRIIKQRKKVYAARTPEERAQIAANISAAKLKKFEDPEYKKTVGEKVAQKQRGKKRKPHTQEWKDNNSRMLREQWTSGIRSKAAASERMRCNNPKHISSQ
jgi:hypothetical protein